MTRSASNSIKELSTHLGVEFPNIARAMQRTEDVRNQILPLLNSLPGDASLVVFGSLARGEATQKSDIDWTLLIDGISHAKHLEDALAIETSLEELELVKPGREGTFGGLAFSHDLVHYIGGDTDTNANMTRRILLLLESSPLGASIAYDRVKQQVLKRYIQEDFGWVYERNPKSIPRFLQNDIARYWRTVAVDFAYKRRARNTKGWALRTVKLRLSRKLTYVSGLLACFSCRAVVTTPDSKSEVRALKLLDHLSRYLENSPLQILAMELIDNWQVSEFRVAARELFEAYDSFLGILDDDTMRTELESLSPEDAVTSALYERARRLGHQFQAGLDKLFLDDNGSPFYPLMRTYGAF